MVFCITISVNAQFFESFNAGIPNNWTVIDNDGGDQWQSTQQGWGGGNGLVIFTDNNSNEDYLITPQFLVTSGISERISFHVLSNNAFQNFEVRLSTTGNAINDFSELIASETDPEAEFSNYTQYEYNLSTYNGQNVYVAIVSTGPETGFLQLDEFSNDSFNCPSPYALSGSPTALTESTFSWRNVAGQSDWTVEYGETGFVLGNGTQIIENSTTGVGFVEVNGLTSGQAYDYYVQSNCGINDSQWVGPFTITQPLQGESVAFPIPLDIFSGDCNTSPSLDFDYNNGFPFFAFAGNTQAYLSFGCDALATTEKVGIWTRFTSPSNGAVRITTTDTNDNFVIHSLNCNSQGICFRNEEVFCYRNPTNNDTQSVISLQPNTEYSLAIWRSGIQIDPQISQICVEPIDCVFPVDLNINIVSATDAELSWTAYDGSQTTWEYVVQEVGMGIPTGSGTSTTNTSTIVTGAENTSYEFYVRTDCGGGLFSDWAGPVEWLQSTIPQNNTCESAEVLTESSSGNCTFFASGNTLGASYAPSNFEDCSFHDEDVWYTFIATSTYYEFEIIPTNADFNDSDYNAVLYNNINDCSTGGDVDNIYCAFNDIDEATVFYGLEIGSTYYLRITMNRSSFEDGLDASFDLCISIPPPPPTNNNCMDAIPIETGMTYTGDTTWATNFDDIPICGISTNDDDNVVWYSYTGSGSEEEIRLLFCDRPFQERVGVFTGDCTNLTCLFSFGQVSFEAQSGCTAGFNAVRSFISDGVSTYYIAIRGDDDQDFGAYSMHVETTLSTESRSLSKDIQIMPNPASTELRVEYKALGNDDLDYELYNQMGQIIKRGKLGDSWNTIDISTLEEGLYFIQFSNNRGQITEKLIIN